MNIKGQQFDVLENHLAIDLHDPYWSAYKKFGWPTGTEGYSVSLEALTTADALGLKIMIRTKYGDYEITASKAFRDGKKTAARNGTTLVCIPKFALTRVSGQPTLEELRMKQAEIRTKSFIE